ncbi:uncharacterized protein LOC134405006 [Elgaria multicarinata webbii]|uniref:uncharacterized protein LOC134405006 n=1 Tax=Elgaria multicarinata webbii TaxID=159646 RepID=UPI002FCD12F5
MRSRARARCASFTCASPPPPPARRGRRARAAAVGWRVLPPPPAKRAPVSLSAVPGKRPPSLVWPHGLPPPGLPTSGAPSPARGPLPLPDRSSPRAAHRWRGRRQGQLARRPGRSAPLPGVVSNQKNLTPDDVVKANFYSTCLAWCYKFNVLDLHYCFRLLKELQAKDGVHWNFWAHRCVTKLLLTHVADAWGVELEKRMPQPGVDWETDVESQHVPFPQRLPQTQWPPLSQFPWWGVHFYVKYDYVNRLSKNICY